MKNDENRHSCKQKKNSIDISNDTEKWGGPTCFYLDLATSVPSIANIIEADSHCLSIVTDLCLIDVGTGF